MDSLGTKLSTKNNIMLSTVMILLFLIAQILTFREWNMANKIAYILFWDVAIISITSLMFLRILLKQLEEHMEQVGILSKDYDEMYLLMRNEYDKLYLLMNGEYDKLNALAKSFIEDEKELAEGFKKQISLEEDLIEYYKRQIERKEKWFNSYITQLEQNNVPEIVIHFLKKAQRELFKK